MEITDSARNRMFSNEDLVRLIIPLIIEQMLTVTVGLADSIMTANVGEEAVSGVSLVDSVMVLMINLFSALATGGAVVAGQFLGQRKNIMACKTADQLILFAASHQNEEEYMKNILKTIPEIEAFYTVGIHKRRINEAEFQDAFRKMIDRNQETTVCFVVGSFYLAGMAKEFINQEEENVRL